MVYELQCDAREVVVTMSGAPAPGGLWQLGAGFRQDGEVAMLHASGPSRGEALTALAEVWASKGAHEGYPRLDWVAIRSALAAVSAV